jgi:alkanesulfonate monooxygenase SsuD/methylene tetrahydromethanopterin reductase-like flavin-dependent oxidoreductase (luciferase family)
VPTAADYPQIVEQVLTAEREGLDLVGIQDHPYQRRFLDTFALIADLLARTSRLRFFPDVASLPMRGPTMLAKAAASLDVMSGGRFELGIGAGAFWDAVAGMGGPRRTNAQAFDALEEAIPNHSRRAGRWPGTARGARSGTPLSRAGVSTGAAAGASGGDLGRCLPSTRASAHRSPGRWLGAVGRVHRS